MYLTTNVIKQMLGGREKELCYQARIIIPLLRVISPEMISICFQQVQL